MKVAVKTLENKDAGEITLDKDVFGVEVRGDIIQRMVHYQLNKRRAGTHQTQGRGDVARTGKKPFKQKGTGSARVGTYTRTMDRGGAPAHGPVSRSHATELPKRVRRAAMRAVLSAKVAAGKLIVVDAISAKDHKTAPVAKQLAQFGLESAVIVGGKEIDTNFALATRNLPRIDVLPTQGANVYDILRRDTLVLTKEAVEALTESYKG